MDIPFNADGKAYSAVLKLLIKDKTANGILVMHVPWMAQPDREVAEALRDSLKRVKRMVLTAWLGSGAAEEAREVFRKADIPTYETPTQAVQAFLYMAEYLRNQEMLIETPTLCLRTSSRTHPAHELLFRKRLMMSVIPD